MKTIDYSRVISAETLNQLSAKEIRAIVELAFYAVVADGIPNEEEEGNLTSAIGRLLGESRQGQIDEIVRELKKDHADRTFKGEHEPQALMAQSAKKLGSDGSRKAAYTVAYAMTMADLTVNDEEYKFDESLRNLLEIDYDEGERLKDAVISAFK